jgi:hypothetical protein
MRKFTDRKSYSQATHLPKPDSPKCHLAIIRAGHTFVEVS